MISAEMPPESEPELRGIVRNINIHRYSQYCRGITSTSSSRVGYVDMEVTQQALIDPTCNRVLYHRGSQ